MNKIIFIFLTICMTSIYAGDSKQIDIEEAITLAKSNNIDLKVAALNLQEKRRGKDTAYNVFYPSISGSGTLSRSNTDPEIYSDNNMLLGYDASFNFTPALFNAITLLKKDYELGEISYAKAVKTLEINIKEIFYNLILLEEQISLLEDNLKTIKNRYELTKINYDAGLVSELELLQIQVSYENFKPEINTINNIYNTTVMNFKNILGVDLNQDIIIDGEINPIVKELNVEEIYQLALDNNHDLKTVYKSEEFLQAQKKTLFSQNFMPVFNISYSQRAMFNDPFEEDLFDTDLYSDDSGSFSVTMLYSFDSLLPNSSARMEIEKVKRSINISRLRGESLLEGLKLQVTNYVSILNNSIKIQEGLGLTVLLAEKSLGKVQQAYAAGTAQLLEVESAENEYKKARLELLKEKFNYNNNLLKLESIICVQ